MHNAHGLFMRNIIFTISFQSTNQITLLILHKKTLSSHISEDSHNDTATSKTILYHKRTLST